MKNEYKITKELMKSWAKEYHLHGAANIVLFILWCIIGICGLLGVILLVSARGDWLNIYFSAFLFLLAVYKLFFSRYVVWTNRYKLLSKTYGCAEWTRTTEFLDNEIVIADHTSVTKFRYDRITKIKEKNNIVMIFFNNNLAIRLYKDAFTEGSWQECKEKIDSKIK